MLVGVKGFFEALIGHETYAGTLKKEALLVDRIAIPNLNQLLPTQVEGSVFEESALELMWLCEQGFVYQPPSLLDMETPILDREFDTHVQTLRDLFSRLQHDRELWSRPEEVLDMSAYAIMLEARLTQIYLQNKGNVNTCCLYFDKFHPEVIQGKRHNVIQAVFKELPIPAKDTPWEHIFEFRSDPESYSKFLALRDWVNEISNSEMTTIEIEEKLEYLIDQYRRHMAVHKMKTNTGLIESMVVSTAEATENLLKVKWGKLASSLFFLRHKKISLMEADLSAPGSQVAYLVKATEAFPPDIPY